MQRHGVCPQDDVHVCIYARYKLLDWCLQNINFAFVHPYVLYGLEVYGNTFPSYLDKLTVLHNKLLRILQNKGHTCCNESLYVQYTLPPVQLPNYQVLNLVHKTVYSLIAFQVL